MEMPWYSVRSFLFLFFCLEATLGQDTYESDFRRLPVIFSEKLLRKSLYNSFVKVSSQELRDTLFFRDPTVEDFMDMDQDSC